MHDCVKTRERLVDLVFDELEPEARRRALLELEGCPDCVAQYRSMAEALRVFDQVTETVMPQEGYWPDYETRLRDRLRSERPNWRRRLADWLGGFRFLTMKPLSAAAVLALVLLAIGWWTWQRRQATGPSPIIPDIATGTPEPRPKVGSPKVESPKVESHDGFIAKTRKPDVLSDRRMSVHPVRRDAPGDERVVDDVVSSAPDQYLIAASLFTPETIRHFEKAQLMLRSFRNESASKSLSAPDLAYERQVSRRLLYQNILLRRDSEMKGNMPAEEALSNLEPFLLDIANLSDHPSPVELGGIRERLQRKELIASLQISSARPSSPRCRIP
jgi:hypothetical protein